MGHCQRQLAARNTTTDDGDFRGDGPCFDRIKKRTPTAGIDVQRLGTHGMVRKAGDVHLRRDADVDRSHIIGNRPLPFDDDLSGFAVDIGRVGQNQPRAGETAQPHQINLEGIAAIMTGNMAGQHACIRCGRAGVDNGQSGTGQRIHTPFAQHQRVGMATAHQHKILGQGDFWRFHGGAFRVGLVCLTLSAGQVKPCSSGCNPK